MLINTNVVNAPREPFVVNQDPGEKSSQGSPLINQNCCYECGDSLDGIFCQQCICKFCGKGAHYGYNCPPKVPIISNPEQCNQTINELPQILPNVHPTCNYEDENSFIYDSKPHSFNVSPSVFNQPPQPQFETYLCELCGNNAHYGYDCSPQFPFISKAGSKWLNEYEERDCEIRIQKLKQDSNEWGSEVRKKEQAYEEEKYSAVHRYMFSIPFVDKDDYIPLGDIIARNSTLEEVNDFEQEEKEFNLEDILQIQYVILREKLLNISRLITNIESLKDNHIPIPVTDSDSSDTFLSHSDNSLPEFESFSDDTKETRSGSTITHANYSLPEYDLFLFEIEPDQGGLTSVVISDNSNDPLLELSEFESFHFDLYNEPSFPHPPPEPPDVEISLIIETDTPVIDNFEELNEDQRGSENVLFQNVEDDDSFTFVIRTFLPFLTYPEVSLLSCSTGSEDTIFDTGIST
ncbi:hypothetical protein Tco_0415239 [Tanacetum coccineum]